MAQGPNYGLQGGSQWIVDSSGTLVVKSGGSVQVESGGVVNVAAGGSIVNAGGQAFSGSVVFSGSASFTGPVGAPNITLGGTIGKWSFGTLALTTGLGTIGFPGFTRVMSAVAVPLLGEPASIGSASHVNSDLSLSGAGSVIFRVGSANGQFGANATVTYQAFGT